MIHHHVTFFKSPKTATIEIKLLPVSAKLVVTCDWQIIQNCIRMNRAYLQAADQPNQQFFVVRHRNFTLPKLGKSEFDSVPTKPQWIYRSSKDKWNVIYVYWLVLQKISIFLEGEKLPCSLFCPSATAVQIGTNKILMLGGENSESVADMLY